MVGFTPDKKQLTKAEYGAAGALSGVFTRFVIQPLDVLKIRFQLQVEPISKSSLSKYHGLSQAFGCILREEGASAFWKGHVTAQVLSVVYGLSQFAVFETLTTAAGVYLPSEYSTKYRPFTHTVCGGLAGSIATVACQPFDVVRTRIIAQGSPKIYRSSVHAAQLMIQQEGFFALYKGLFPSLLAIGPQAGLQFGFYTTFTQTWAFVVRRPSDKFPSSLESLLAGSAAGLCAKLIIYPLDLTKKRLEIQGFASGRASFGQTHAYNGFIHCITTIVQKEGLSSLYKGLTPSMLKASLSTGCIFFAYEQLCKLLMYTHYT